MIAKNAIDIISKPGFTDNYAVAMQALISTGVLELLRSYARPVINPISPALTETAAAQAHFCAGYHQALEDLEYFVQIYGNEKVQQSNKMKMDFGGLSSAIANGNLTKEEAELARRKL